MSAEVEHAYRLFTRETDGPILVSHLKKVARDLKEDVSDELLRDMIREANGGDGLHAGVNYRAVSGCDDEGRRILRGRFWIWLSVFTHAKAFSGLTSFSSSGFFG